MTSTANPIISMTMDAPYRLSINGELVAEYQDEAEAEARYQTLLGRPTATPPAELTDRFLPSEHARFELLRCAGPGLSMRLWKSTITRYLDDRDALDVVKFHITEQNDATCLFMSREKTALENFGLYQRMASQTA